ncbi:MAG: DUF4105 domain-containing protein [Chitinophagaceae bacterium]|nr:MAG: DUF4105 domain-containing protein [Chitinophagaceae bacterium]
MRLIATFILLFTSIFASAQTDSCNLRISILTCGPGEDLYSIFGHSAVRIQDSASRTDIVYNYGTMDFDDPSFYLKFMRGEMRYFLSYTDYPSFMYEYQVTRRSVIEQNLQLSCDDKKRILTALQTNALDENKYYSYSFLYDNCSSRIRDIAMRNAKSLVRFKDILPARVPTFRNMIHEYLHRGQQHWSKLGIDLLLGANIDIKVSNEESMFLPDYLMKGFDSAVVLKSPAQAQLMPMVGAKQYIYQPPVTELSLPWYNPYFILAAVSILLLIFSFRKRTYTRTSARIDKYLFLVTGLLGTLMLALWLFREDTVCSKNWNLVWALPTHVIAAFYIRSNKPWVGIYFRVAGILGALLLLGWWWWPQQMNSSLVAPVLLLVIRAFTISYKTRNNDQNIKS